jgi:short-subunit dehydrogenase
VATPFDLTDRVAFVTGAGRGIGRQIARTLAEAGAHVAAVGQTADVVEEAAEEVRQRGRRSLAITVDVADSAQVDDAVGRALGEFGRIDILVNSAGIARHGASEETSDGEWRRILDVNLDGTYWCCRAVGRHTLERGSGAIVNIASMSGTIVNVPQPQAAYNASKAFIDSFAFALRAELKETGVTVTCLMPGATDTDFFRKAHMEDASIVQDGKLGPADKVARDGYEALMRGDREIVSGIPNKIQDLMANVMPEKMVAKRAKKMHQPKHEEEEAE